MEREASQAPEVHVTKGQLMHQLKADYGITLNPLTPLRVMVFFESALQYGTKPTEEGVYAVLFVPSVRIPFDAVLQTEETFGRLVQYCTLNDTTELHVYSRTISKTLKVFTLTNKHKSNEED